MTDTSKDEGGRCGGSGFVDSGHKTKLIPVGDVTMVLDEGVSVQMPCPACATRDKKGG